GRMETRIGEGVKVAVVQATEYPRGGHISIRVDPSRGAEFAVKLRVPYWSRRTKVRVNGEAVQGVKSGAYLALNRRWKRGDRIELSSLLTAHSFSGADGIGH
ncbi:MAG TPA: hypothetical protein EYO84_03030, partial [Planctomycetes bacterium]|nr:hypothetical protein [Planctomycetota bacterium]